jgi:hypothetical protein
MEDVRIKLAATWIAAMFGYIYGDILGFFVPGAIETIMAGTLPIGSPLSLLGAAMLMSLPGFMVFFSLTLPYKATRWANMIMGIFHIIVIIGAIVTPPPSTEIYFIYLAIVEISFNILAFWYAWTWIE